MKDARAASGMYGCHAYVDINVKTIKSQHRRGTWVTASARCASAARRAASSRSARSRSAACAAFAAAAACLEVWLSCKWTLQLGCQGTAFITEPVRTLLLGRALVYTPFLTVGRQGAARYIANS